MLKLRRSKRLGWALCLLGLSALIAACGAATSPEAQSPEAGLSSEGEGYPLIPRKVLFSDPQKSNVQLSPDGKHLSFLAPVNGVSNIWVGPADNPSQAKPVSDAKATGIFQYQWSYLKDHLIFLQDRTGDENWRAFALDVSRQTTLDLTPLEGVRAQLHKVSSKVQGEVVIALNDRDPRYYDLYRVNLVTGERKTLQENHGYHAFALDSRFNVRFVSKSTKDGGQQILHPKGILTLDDLAGKFSANIPVDGWSVYSAISLEDSDTTQLLGFDASDNTLYLRDSRKRDTAALFAIDLTTNEKQLLAEDAQADASSYAVHPATQVMQAAGFNYDKTRWQYLDKRYEKAVLELAQIAVGQPRVVSRTHDDKRWVVAFLRDDGPTQYFIWNNDTNVSKFLFVDRPDLEPYRLSKMRPVVITSRDGMDLVSYLSLPPGSDANDDGVPEKPLPLVLWVHGGPWLRTSWGFHPKHQWFTNRGYAVLDVNYRSTVGYGKNHLNAGNREWAGKMHNDLLDGVQWAIDHQIAQPDKIAIAGFSYGGYATLVGLTFTPDTFVCGVDIAGPTNLVTLLESIPPYWESRLAKFYQRIGNPTTDEGRQFLDQRSPVTFVDNVRRPLLIGQGANDARVKQAEAERIVNAMEEKQLPVTYVLYPDEGHKFQRPENRYSFNAIADAFLADCLGGRSEPFGTDFEGSTLTVPVGAAFVPGLESALSAHPASQAATH